VKALAATKASNENPYQRSSTMPYDPSAITIGDIVKAKVDNLYFEGVVVEVNDTFAYVDFGDAVEKVLKTDCYIIIHAADIEMGDTVEVRSPGQYLYHTGEVIAFNLDGTVNVKMRSDASDNDVEMFVKMSNLRKIMTNREMSIKRDYNNIFNDIDNNSQVGPYLDDVVAPVEGDHDTIAETSEDFDMEANGCA
jgi:hypothetical protein